MSRREIVWLSVLVLFAVGLLVASWYVDEQADRTNLLNAAANGQLEIAAATIEDVADVNFRDKDGCTPLHHAVNGGDIEMVRLLIAHGADSTIPCYDTGRNWHSDGATPLHGAWRTEIIGALIAGGADVNARDAAGNTPMHFAVQHLNLEGIEKLVASGADTTARNAVGDLPVDMFAKYSQPHYPPLDKRTQDVLRKIYGMLGPPTPLMDYIVQNML